MALHVRLCEASDWEYGQEGPGLESGPTRWGSGKRRETEGTQSRFHPFGPRLSISKGGGSGRPRERHTPGGRRTQESCIGPRQPGPRGARAAGTRGATLRLRRAAAGRAGRRRPAAIGARRSPSANGRRGRVGAGRKPHLKLCDASRLPLPLRRRSVSLPDPTVAARYPRGRCSGARGCGRGPGRPTRRRARRTGVRAAPAWGSAERARVALGLDRGVGSASAAGITGPGSRAGVRRIPGTREGEGAAAEAVMWHLRPPERTQPARARPSAPPGPRAPSARGLCTLAPRPSCVPAFPGRRHVGSAHRGHPGLPGA